MNTQCARVWGEPADPTQPYTATPTVTAKELREQQYAAERAQGEAASRRELEELFDHRSDGLAANRRFNDHLAWHVAVYGDGTSRLTVVSLLSELKQAEKLLRRQRGCTCGA